jgi:hypothetical protein
MTEHEPYENDPLPDEDKSLSDRLKEWAGEIVDPREAAEYDETKTNPVTGQPLAP